MRIEIKAQMSSGGRGAKSRNFCYVVSRLEGDAVVESLSVPSWREAMATKLSWEEVYTA